MTPEELKEKDEQEREEGREDLEAEDSAEETKESKDSIADLEKQVADMKELAQRTQAEFMNYKKRVAKEKQDLTVFANENIITQLLSVLDNFQRALDSEEDTESTLYKGVGLIKKELENVLKQNGLEEMECLNQPFDPNYHHAVMQVEVEGKEANTVVEVLQTGYKLKERVIRPAMVNVSK